jgi:peptide deformylase
MTNTTAPVRVLTILNDQDVMTLRTKSMPVEQHPLSKETQDVIATLKRVIVERNGLGMSAIQLGIAKNVFVMKRPWNSQQLVAIINPKILRGSGSSTKQEGCFSIDLPPNTIALVRRMSMIYVQYTTEDGHLEDNELMVGMDARVFQHEYQHLQGELMIDEGNKYGTFVGIKRSF